ncbi:MAG: dipeptide ABC transporter ATP-binding protein [Planctomycetota bacterium]
MSVAPTPVEPITRTVDAPLLSIKNLEVHFGSADKPLRAVDGISYDIARGETFCVVGESGSGKSITALSAMRLVPSPPGRIAGGLITLDGSGDLTQLPERQMRKIRGSKIAMIFQEPMTSLNPVYTIGDQIGEALKLHLDMNRREARDRTLELLEQVQIRNPKDTIDEYPHRFSGGMRQRVMIAMAIACEPDLLIADEPTTALDVTIQAEILRLIAELQERNGMSVMFITHDFDVVAEIADHVAVMRYGKIVEQGTKQEVLRNPTHPYTQELIAALPRNLKRLREEEVAAKKAEGKPVVDPHPSHDETAPGAATDAVLQVRDLRVWFPVKKGLLQRTVDHVKAVDDVSFDLPKSQILAVVGESGSGKTTLGRAILQLVPPTAGSVIFEGDELVGRSAGSLRPYRRNAQIIFQDPYSALNPRMTIGGMLTEIMRVHKIGDSKADRQDRAEAVMKRVELEPEMLRRYPHEFSGGQRQRIGIARALILQPRFIVCDEVTSALDVSVQAKLLQLLLDLRDEFGLTYLFITHNLGVVEFLADETLVMYKGKIAERGPTEQVVNDPQDDYTKKLLAAVPRM